MKARKTVIMITHDKNEHQNNDKLCILLKVLSLKNYHFYLELYNLTFKNLKNWLQKMF